ncbi:MAG: SRPBCC family protein [Anaerolineae bacterium]
MLRMEKSVVINRPVEEVFAAVEFDRWSQWASELVETKKTSEGPPGVGTTYTHVAQMLGRRLENGYEVTEYEPNSKISMKSTSGPIPVDSVLSVESVEGGTRFTMNFKADVGRVFKLAEPLIARIMDRQQDANLANLKDLLEAGALDSA